MKLQANHDFETCKDTNLRVQDVEGWLGLCQLTKQWAGEGGAGWNKGRTDRTLGIKGSGCV